MKVQHSVFGPGTVTRIDEEFITIAFPQFGKDKSFLLMPSFAQGQLTTDIPNLEEKTAIYYPVIDTNQKIRNVKRALKIARQEFEQYKEYLE